MSKLDDIKFQLRSIPNAEGYLKIATNYLREKNPSIKLWIRSTVEQHMAYITYGDNRKQHFKAGGKNIREAIISCIEYFENFKESYE